jgi:hypothetical protein
LIEIDALHSDAVPPGNVTRMISQERQILAARCRHLQHTAAIVTTACRVIASSAVATGRPHRVAEMLHLSKMEWKRVAVSSFRRTRISRAV